MQVQRPAWCEEENHRTACRWRCHPLPRGWQFACPHSSVGMPPSSHRLHLCSMNSAHLYCRPHILQQQAALWVQANRLGAGQAEQALIKKRGTSHPSRKPQGARLRGRRQAAVGLGECGPGHDGLPSGRNYLKCACELSNA